VLRQVDELLGQLDQQAAHLTPRPDRLRRLRALVGQLEILRRRARTLALSDTDRDLVEAAVTHLQRLLELVKELDEVDHALHRLAADLRTRACGAPPRPSA
jgi:phage shock protein A